MRTKLLTMLTVLLALFSTSLKAQETTYYWYLGWDTEDWWNNLDKLTSTDNFNVTYTNEMPNTYNATNGEAYALKGTREDNYLALVIPADWPCPTLYSSGKDGTYGIGSDSKSVTIDGVEYKLYSSYGTTSDPYCYINEVIYTPEHYWYVGWTQPTSLEGLKTLATTADGCMSLGGAVGELGGKLLTNSSEIGPMLPPATFYVAIPIGYDIYDATLPNVPLSNTSFTKVTDVTIANHNVYVFNDPQVTVSGLEIYMDAERPKYYWYLGWDNEDWWSNLDKLTSTEDFNVTYTNEMPNSYNTTDGGLYALKGTCEDNYWALVIPAEWPLPTLYNLTKGMKYELDPNGQLVTIDGVEYKLYSSGGTTSNPYCYINPGEPSSIEPEPEPEPTPEPETTYYWYLGTEKLLTDKDVEAKGVQMSDKSEITTLTWESAEYVYFIYPKEFGKAVIIDEGGDEAGGKAVEALSNVNLEKYTGWRFNKDSQGAEFSISFTEPEYTVSLDHTNVTLAVGESVTLTATVTPEGATTESMWWQVYDTNIATVENGVVTAVSEGSTRVIVHVGDYFAACQVTVEAAAVEPEAKYYWYVGNEIPTADTYTSLGQSVTSLEEIPFPYITTTSLMPMVMFAPSECRVVAANSQDKTTSISDITAESNVPGYNCYKMTAASAGARIYIASPEKFITLSILVINETMSLAVNETEKIRAFAKSYGGSAPYDGAMTWTTSDAGVAIVDNEGLVAAISAGTATLTVTANDGTGVSATCVVTVEAAAVEPEPTPITSIEELNNVTLYYISLPNHKNGLVSWAAAENGLKMKSCADLGVAPDANDTKQQFAFISNDDGATRYLYHAAEKKFVAKDGSLCEYPHDALSFVAGAYEGTFVAHFDDSHYINVGGSSQMAVDSWTTADGGNSAVILPVGEYDPAEALAAFEKELPTVTGITSIDELSNEKLYYVSLPSHTNGLVSWAVNGEALKSSKDLGIISCPGNSFQQFAFINYGGEYYLYHAASKMFVGANGTLSDTPASTVSFSAGNVDGTFVVCFDNAHYINVGGSNQMIIDGWNTPDGGNSCVIAPVADFDPAEAIEAIKTTGIESSVFEVQGSQLIYDLQGRRVTHPTKGIYIVNGKKVIMK